MKRTPYEGVSTIVRLNWPYYLGAALVALVATSLAFFLSNPAIRIICAIALGGALWFIIGSLGAAWLVYDRSDLYRFRWLDDIAGGTTPHRFIFCHCGFDDLSPLLREKLRARDGAWTILDHFQPGQMTEPSIRRARALYPPGTDAQPATYDHWPVAAHSADKIFALLAIHELRSDSERTRWFAEAHRCLASEGRIVLAEHLRDGWNFLAFGPGFLHFHSAAAWRRSWERAGLRLVKEHRVTPFVRFFVLAAT